MNTRQTMCEQRDRFAPQAFYTERALYVQRTSVQYIWSRPHGQSSVRDEPAYELYTEITSQSPNRLFRQKSVLTGKCFEQIDMYSKRNVDFQLPNEAML